MLSLLKQPYPFFHKGRSLWRNALLILVISFFFEYLLEPFNVERSEHKFDYWVIVFLHSGNAAVIYLLYYFLFGQLVFEDDWKIYKEAAGLLLLLILIGSGGFLLREVIYNNPNNVSLGYYFEEVKNTILVGSIILFAIISINFRIRRRRNQERAGTLTVSNADERSDQKTVQIQAAIAADHFEVQPSEILCIRSDGNYLEFYLKKGDLADRVIKRLTLQSATDQLSEFPFILKTHRAFLVNTQYISRVEGNAQGYQLTVTNLHFSIPVSRKHLDGFNGLMR